jgi:rhodanese-related sulfurtransferase
MMSDESTVEVITAPQLKKLLATDHPPIVLDVREDDELKICAMPTFIHISLGDLSQKWNQLPKDQLIVTVCHHGYRSLQAALFLKSHGFDQVLNLEGGIQAWADQVDADMVQY